MKAFENFPCLKGRFENSFFTGLLNRYMVVLSYFSEQTKIPLYAVIEEVLSLILTDRDVTLNKYDFETLYRTTYPAIFNIGFEKKQLMLLDDFDRLIVTAIQLYLNHKIGMDEIRHKQLDELIELLAVHRIHFPANEPVLKIMTAHKQIVKITGKATMIKSILKFTEDFHPYHDKFKERPWCNAGYEMLCMNYLVFTKNYAGLHKLYIDGRVKRVINKFYALYKEGRSQTNEIKKAGTIFWNEDGKGETIRLKD
jgi:hypothetical protein